MALHVGFAREPWLHVAAPELASVDWLALALDFAAQFAVLKLRISPLAFLAAGAVLGAVTHQLLGR